MATKKTPKKTSLKSTKKPSKEVATPETPQRTVGELRQRPFAVSPAPEHCRVDLCTAQAEWMRTLYPDSPQPVFSSLALVNGRKSRGAQRLRPGFSFTPSMDLAWALGFPSMVFIVDGVPVPDTVLAMMDFYQVEQKRARGHEINWWGTAQIEHGKIYTRRAAMARSIELSPYPEGTAEEQREEFAARLFDLDLQDAEDASAETEINDYHLHQGLIRSEVDFDDLTEDAHLFTALLGPQRVTAALMDIAERDPTTIRPSTLFYVLAQVAVSLTEGEFSELAERARAWSNANASTKEVEEARWIYDGLAWAEQRRKKKKEYGLFRTLILGLPEDKVRAEILRRPHPRWNDLFFVDPDEALAVLARGSDFDERDIELGHLRSLSSIAAAGVVTDMLKLGVSEQCRDQVKAWFEARGEWTRPHLDRLASGSDARLSKLALATGKRLRP